MRISRTVNLRMALALIAFAALAGALLMQEHRSSARERELRKQLIIARALPSAHERMREFLGDMGMVILGDASRAEVLQVTGGYQEGNATAGSLESDGGYPVVLTGEVFDAPFVRRLAGELRDVNNYICIGASDLPDPMFGVRLWRGKESLDVLFSLESQHIDVWAFTRNERGEVVHGEGYLCSCSGSLGGLVHETIAKATMCPIIAMP